MKHESKQIDDDLIYKIAVECMNSYKVHKHLRGSTEYALTIIDNNGKPLQVLSIPGTSGLVDWFWNILLYSVKGVKLCTYLAANRIHKAVKGEIDPDIELAVTGHSKDASTALQYMSKYEANYCVAFCPSPAFRRFEFTWTFPFIKRREYDELKNTVVVYDPDDIVPAAGILNFGHRLVERVRKLPKDKTWRDLYGRVADHLMVHIVRYFYDTK